MLNSLFLIIINWNLKCDTIECINSLLDAGVFLNQIILVDNHSTDGSPEAIGTKYGSSLHLVITRENLGFAGGVNIGIDLARQLDAKWVMILNNDVIVAPDLIAQLEKAVDKFDDRTIFSPLILNYYHPDLIDYAGDSQIFGTLLTRPLYKNQRFEQLPDFLPIDFITGCAMLIPIYVLENVGLFDTRYFMYAEDADFVWRCRKQAYHFVIATKAKILHKVSLSTTSDRPNQRLWRIRNQVWFYRLHAPIIHLPFLFIFTIFRSFFMGGKDFINRNAYLVLPLMKGWFTGWFGPISGNNFKK